MFAYLNGDIKGKKIIDLGCGSGIIGIGAKLLGAREVVGVDVDKEALKVARENSKIFKLDIRWVNKDVVEFNEKCDTIIQNPPFGTKRRSIDKIFLEKALLIGKVVYSIHKAGNRKFIEGVVKSMDKGITHVLKGSMVIPWMFPFHRKKAYSIEVEVYRVE